ncbi:MAG TPA: peptidylprolyl isomerase [Candidatus Limnocylindria bacterium]|nr:peptidylprolyl isomerase [Candidatus Limnocylindria bacterium]
MSFRNRPVLDRRHRPRWQDELRTQRLVVAGFAIAIALAIGIFGATLWTRYYDGQLRPVAAVAATTFDRADLALRERILTSERVARLADLQSQVVGGANDTLVQQEMQTVQSELSSIATAAADSLVRGAVLRGRAGDLRIAVAEEEVDAEWNERRTIPERLHLNLILVRAEPAPAEDDSGEEPDPAAEPTEADFARAESEAAAARERIEGGEEFEAVAREVSDHFSAEAGGDLGLVETDSEVYAPYVEAVAEVEDGEVVGPLRVEDGWALVRLEERAEEHPNDPLIESLRASGVGDGQFRDYLRDQLLEEAFRAHFEDEIAVSPQPQRRIAQIYIAAGTGGAGPMQRARHVLVQPLPGESDQAAATEQQWQAALAEAEQVRAQLAAPDADWFALAEEHSDDQGSAVRGGDLGWFDPAAPGFVAEFTTALAELEPGELSEPVRSQFGYHVIQLTGERESAAQQAEEVAAEAADDPDAFADLARRVSEDHETAREGGEVGWIARYELDPTLEDAVFGLEQPDEVSDVIEVAGDGYYIVKLLETSERRPVEAARLETIRSQGFDRWLEQLESEVAVWIDPEFAASEAAES